MPERQLTQVRSLRLAAWTTAALGVAYAIDTVMPPTGGWLDRFVDPTSGWGMVLTSVRAVGHFLAAGIMAVALLTMRDRWVWRIGVLVALIFGLLSGARYVFPGPTVMRKGVWIVEAVLGGLLLVLLLLPASRAAFGRRGDESPR